MRYNIQIIILSILLDGYLVVEVRVVMKMIRLLIAALLAAALILATGSTIMAPNLKLFSSPDLSLGTLGFNQMSYSDIGKTPILFAPSSRDLMFGGGIGAHYKPKLMTNNWTSSMKTSQINQMFAMMLQGIGGKKSS